MEHIIRKMKKEDIQQVQQVAKTSWNHTYENIIPMEVQESFLRSAYSDEMMQSRLEHSYMNVALVNGNIVGFANYSPVQEGGKVELYAIYLYPEYQGKGIGTSLLIEGIKSLENVKEIYINVEKNNNIGKTFYISKGFEKVSEYDDELDGHTLRTIRMVLKV
ncbi:GNAT family N-acetyltransferase [Lederbergia wuyishanensis]|uniref:Ribosomal protein S18 acetylase RimI-like enzyme n=1 Tax=Lederbergia wuyishanensis TaxID=1347903 RepID=A0ABU0D3M8_9BACI|nr:GNAT family N-acetyltransferase [Lederbergia wuyishanensis]MCJ8007825.1 GNAT family N-acetyltransferase [Lederbergia wuyishanensis]MDQ0343007.1 ribosomal protein S18 acetylase RimI-like enzyme [Lederbergia wuyishanensis]